MKFAALSLCALLALAGALVAAEANSPLDFKVDAIDGKPADLSQYKGNVVLMVNVASKCGNTPQYKPLEAMYSKYKEQGFTVMGFPANEFGAQEPGTNEQIQQFCTETFKVDFPMFSKIVVKGEAINPLYKFLTSQQTEPVKASPISWNFEKFLVGRDGKVIKRFSPRTQPDAPEVVAAIEAELAKGK